MGEGWGEGVTQSECVLHHTLTRRPSGVDLSHEGEVNQMTSKMR